MAAEFLWTLGDASQLEDAIDGILLNGRSEGRIAIVGRSNVGKSSLINRLVGSKVAQTSAQPGKTRALHFYDWKDGKKIIVDLPGYGFAKQSKDDRQQWANLIADYIQADEGLECGIVLLDARNGPSDKDVGAIDFLRDQSIPMLFVVTKIDLWRTQSDRIKRIREIEKIIGDMGYGKELIFYTSSEKGTGMRELQAEVKREAAPTKFEE
ncbi:MAG: ribosome biogenesis GTP-binding protein YsxC [Cryobacterium sp.]|nr:ribosome biogenesis GTP-binding protein YsxC [Oligoflexia bacterium]